MKSRKRIWKNKNFKLACLSLMLFLLAPISHADGLEVCYEASFIFKIGESCISYEIDDDTLKIESSQHTTGIVDLAHHIEQKVSSEVSMNPFGSQYLFFYEKNEHKTMTHHYFFKDKIYYSSNSYRYKNKKYKNAKKVFEKKDVLDPTAAVIYMQLHDLMQEEGKLTSFFEGKYVDITYKNDGYEDVSFEGRLYRCRRIEFKVPVSTSSLVTPTGSWKIFIDESTGVIMGLELKFPLGRAKLKPVRITGDKELFQKYMSKSL